MVNVVKVDLTAKQREILKQITDEAHSVKQIAEERGVSQQAIYAQLRIIIKKGWLRKAYSANYVRCE